MNDGSYVNDLQPPMEHFEPQPLMEHFEPQLPLEHVEPQPPQQHVAPSPLLENLQTSSRSYGTRFLLILHQLSTSPLPGQNRLTLIHRLNQAGMVPNEHLEYYLNNNHSNELYNDDRWIQMMNAIFSTLEMNELDLLPQHKEFLLNLPRPPV